MTTKTATKEHVYQLIDELDDTQLKELERELVRRLEATKELDRELARRPEETNEGDPAERPYDPLGAIIGRFDDVDGPTDVSSNKYKYVADAIQHW